MRSRIIGAIFLAATLFFTACQSDTDRRDVPDVSDIVVDIQLRRFEQDLFELDTNKLLTLLPALEEQYPVFSQLYLTRILPAKEGDMAPEEYVPWVQGFMQHESVQQLYDTTQIVYGDFAPYEAEFVKAFQFFNYYFPEKNIPDLTTFISEFSVGTFIYGENSLGIGLDFFLGKEYPYAQYNPTNPAFSAYLTRTFTPEHLVLKTMIPLVEDIVGPPQKRRLLDLMINEGKQLYILDHLLPFEADSIKLEMTSDQVSWLNANEREIWAYFLSEDLLYSTDYHEIRKFVEYSPHSPGMPEQAPGRTGSWIGWQIIKAYMKQHPDLSMDALIALPDAQEILAASRYKPKR